MIAAVQERPAQKQQSEPNLKRILNPKTPVLVGGLHLRRFSLEEYQQLIALGFFHEDERLELINGFIQEMSPINPKHAECVDQLVELFFAQLLKRARIRIQSPVALEVRSSQPEPDVALAAVRPTGYADQHPDAENIFLIVEISDSTLEKDQAEKLELYAASGIVEYWIVNLVDEQFEVYRDPFVSAIGKAAYRTKLTFIHGQSVSPLAFPDCQIDVSQVLPKQGNK